MNERERLGAEWRRANATRITGLYWAAERFAADFGAVEQAALAALQGRTIVVRLRPDGSWAISPWEGEPIWRPSLDELPIGMPVLEGEDGYELRPGAPILPGAWFQAGLRLRRSLEEALRTAEWAAVAPEEAAREAGEQP